MNELNQSSLNRLGLGGSVFRRLWGIFAPLLALALVLAFFSLADWKLADGTFSSIRNIRTITVQTCVVAMAALGMTVIIIAGGIDLSAGTALALCATTLAWGVEADVAFLARHGETFAGASIAFDQAQKNLTAAQRSRNSTEGSNEDATAKEERLQGEVEKKRTRLISLARHKLAQAKRRQDSSSVGLIEKKIELLKDPSFRTDTRPLWLSGVYNDPFSAYLAIVIAMATGLFTGLLNGLLISWLRIVPFIVTLGTMTIFVGTGNLLSGNTPIRPSQQYQIPDWILHIASNSNDALWFGTFPTGVFLVLLLSVLLSLVLRYTVFGRYVFAVGSNEATARLCGINVPLVKISLYTLAGVFFGVAGICHFSRASTGNPMSGMGLELSVIAAVVIGGGSLNGGRGSVIGTLAGAAIMQIIDNGCTHLELADPIKKIILGTIIIGAVTIDQIRQKWSAH